MFTGATTIRVSRQGEPVTSYGSWFAALPNIRIGDELWGFWPDGTWKCADVVKRDFRPDDDMMPWKPILRPR